jgi:photosystem II stability/assembly factor-like uncharacterized protein
VTRRPIPMRLLSWTGIAGCALAGAVLMAQQPAPVPELPAPVNQSDDPLLEPFVWRSIGPAIMGGRVDDIAIHESDLSTIYVGYATGGLWKTVNNGTTWTPVFDEQPNTSIGALAIAPSDPKIIYVGTGEPNNRQSSSFGAGVFKSIDAGETWIYVGLKETQTIGRLAIHPKDPNIVYVAAVGALFGPNPERGVYKTTDGGKTWTNTNFIDNDTGFIDIVMHSTRPDTLLAASYQRRRQPWGFNGGGPGSGIWKTENGGRTWTKLTGSGLPANPVLGRIGLNYSRSNPDIVYAQIEVGPPVATTTPANGNGNGESMAPPQGGGRGGGQQAPDPTRSGVWRSTDGGRTWQFRSNNNNRPMYYSKIRVDPSNADIVYTMGVNASQSFDGGLTWTTLSGPSHVDHHQLWINQRDGRHLVIGNDGGIDVSYDRGETWEEIATKATGQFYAVSADMRKPYYICGGLQDNGSWCGPSAVRTSAGILNTDWYRIGGGDGFYTANDPTDWTIGYAESQNGNTNRYDLKTGRSTSIRPRAAMTPEQIKQAEASGRGAGPGAAVGNVVPPVEPGTAFRFNWSTPFVLSKHDPRVIYLGGDRLFRSTNRGDTWTASADLTRNIGRNDRPIMGVPGDAPMASKHDGVSHYSNITTLAESPLVPGLVWVGTVDGNVQVSRDFGATFTNVTAAIPGVPDETQVSRVEPSHHAAGTAYVSFDGHRTDDHHPYIFKTTDYGKTWTALANNLPRGNVNVVKEDPRNPDLLYAGTEYGFYVSLDGGREWKRFMTGLPTVRVDDVMVHPRDNDLILGTHGRSIWIIDDITPLQQLAGPAREADVHLFDIRPATRWMTDITRAVGVGAAKHFRGQNPQGGTAISYLLRSEPSGDVQIAIANARGEVVRTIQGTKHAGMNRVQWNLSPNPPPPPPGAEGRGGGGRGGGRGGGAPFMNNQAVEAGTYTVTLTVGGRDYMTTVVVEADRVW